MAYLRIFFFVGFIVLSSLYGRCDSQEHRIQALWQQCERARSLSAYQRLDTLSLRFLRQLGSHHDSRMQAYASYYRATALVFTGRGREALPLMDRAWNLSQQAANDSVGALVMNIRGIYQAMYQNNSFLAQHYFFKSLALARSSRYESLKIRVYGNLLTLSKSPNDKTLLGYAKAIYQYGLRHNDFEQTYMGAYYLALYYKLNRQYREAQGYLDKALSLYRQRPYDDVASVYVLYSETETGLDHLSAARQWARQSVVLARQWQQTSLLPDAYLQVAIVENKDGQYAESNRNALKAVELSNEHELSNRVIDCYRLIADYYLKLGNSAGAIEYLQAANRGMDTLSSINMQRLMRERSMQDSIEKKEQIAEVRMQKITDQRRMLTAVCTLAIVLLLLLIIIIIVLRSRNRMIKSIVEQNVRAVEKQKASKRHIMLIEQQLDAARQELETRTSSPTITGDSPSNDKKSIDEQPDDSSNDHTSGLLLDDDGRMQELYDRACHVMETDKPYHEPRLTREKLAKMLGTNRTYLSTVIHAKGGMSYQQFVNTYRINEAIEVLSDASQIERPLKQLWSDLGFTSPSTFYKLFQQSVGITPLAFRKQIPGIKKPTAQQDDTD